MQPEDQREVGHTMLEVSTGADELHRGEAGGVVGHRGAVVPALGAEGLGVGGDGDGHDEYDSFIHLPSIFIHLQSNYSFTGKDGSVGKNLSLTIGRSQVQFPYRVCGMDLN